MACVAAVSAPESLGKDKNPTPVAKVEGRIDRLGNWGKAGPSSGCLELNYSKFICKMDKDYHLR